ncbi:peptide ABC transporter substrate-binding protein [Niveispirillum fermenti]|uniref:peptide ABC transporter substrate-binding protein n=1 Tax=Niveispirillum fermenti TaxID=1233113 RepID=UPI003A8699E0
MSRCLALLLFCLALALPPAAAETVLRLGNGPDSESLDPHRAVGAGDSRILTALFEGLLTPDAAGRMVPGAAESWTVSDDGLTYTFILRADGRWSDGSPVTAADFVYSWRRAVDPATRPLFADFLYPVLNAQAVAAGRMPPEALGVAALDMRSFQVRLAAPKPNFTDYLYHRATYPVHPPSVAAHGDGFARAGHLVSNGPYRLDSQRPQSHVGVVRNPHFHDAASVAFDKVLFFTTEDGQAELRRFRAGELDITETVPPSQLDWVRAHLGDALRLAPRAGINFIAPNMRVEPWKSNRALRLALSLTIDRETIAGRILRDGDPAHSFVPPGLPDYDPALPVQAGWTQGARDALARTLFAQAGYGPDRPLTVNLLYPTGEMNKQIAVAVAARWQSVLGVRTQLENQEFKVVMGRVRDGSYPGLVLRQWFWVFPEKYLEILRTREQHNGNGYASPAFDAAMAAADAATDRAGMARALRRAEALMLDDAALMPVLFATSRHLVAPRIGGWVDNLRDSHPVRHLAPQEVAKP